MNETREKILDTAERLFGNRGYAGTSLRQIIAEAGVNLAAIHYHFGSKEELLDNLLLRKAGTVNGERLALLDRYEAEAGSDPVPVEKLLSAFLEPPLLRMKENPEFARLMGRLYGEGLAPAIVEKHFQPVMSRFLASFGRTLPTLSQAALGLRLKFVNAAMAQSMLYPLAAMSRELLAFATGGLCAPAVVREITEEKK